MNPQFNNQFICIDAGFFTQIKATSMDTVFAPSYANLKMKYHETQVYFMTKNTLDLAVNKYFEENWFRFLND